MINIYIKRTIFELSPYNLGESPTLERRLSLYNLEMKKYDKFFFKYELNEKSLRIPRGLGIEEIKSCFLQDNIYDYKIINDIKHFTPHRETTVFNVKEEYAPRDVHQENFIEFLIKEDPIKLLMAETGFGKTFCTIMAGSVKKIPMIIIVNTVTLLNQWKKAILEFTDCIENEIFIIKGSNSIEKLLKRKQKFINERFYIAQIQTLAIAAENDLLDDLYTHLGLGIAVFDEAHKCFDANIKILLSNNIRYTYYLTATPGRTNVIEDIMYNRLMRHVPRYGSYTADLNIYINSLNVFINSRPSEYDEQQCLVYNFKMKTFMFNALKYEDFIFTNPKRVDYFCKIAEKFLKPLLEQDLEAKALIILSRIESMRIMSEKLKKNLRIPIGVLNSEVKKTEERQKELNKKVVLSSIGSAGAGLDIKRLRIVICYVPFTSKIVLHQLMGRLRYIPNTAVYYVNIIDEGFNNAFKQGTKRMFYIKNKSKSIRTIKLPMEDIL